MARSLRSSLRDVSDANKPPERPLTPAPRRATVRRMPDIDACDMFARGTLAVAPGASSECLVTAIPCGPIMASLVSWPVGVRGAASIGDRYVVVLSGQSTMTGEHGGTRFVAEPGRKGALLSPGRPSTANINPGCQAQNIIIPPALVATHLTTLTGREARAPIQFDVGLDLEAGPGATFFGVAHLLWRELERPMSSPLLITGLRDMFLTALLTCARHSASTLLEPAPSHVAPAYVRRAEEYIEAHAADPLTLADIVGAARAPARSLQVAFRAHRGTTPMEFLRRCRFELARRRLLKPAPEANVTSIACASGFSHLGEFGAEYRRLFGERPSDTLRRAR